METAMTLKDIAKMIPRGKITTPSGDAYHLSRFGRVQMLEAVEAAMEERRNLFDALRTIVEDADDNSSPRTSGWVFVRQSSVDVARRLTATRPGECSATSAPAAKTTPTGM